MQIYQKEFIIFTFSIAVFTQKNDIREYACHFLNFQKGCINILSLCYTDR